MKAKNELPIFKPFYSLYHNVANGTAISEKSNCVRNWYLNEVMTLRCHRGFLYSRTAPIVSIAGSSYKLNPYLKKETFSTKYFGNSLHEVIHKLIDDGYYVVFEGIDEYFIKQCSRKKQPLGADGLIFGYNDKNKTYSMLAYDKNQEYICFYVPQKSFTKANDLALKNGESGILYGIKADGENPMFSPLIVVRKFKEYLNSNLKNYRRDMAEEAYGTVVHDYIAMYLDGLIDGTISYDQQNKKIFYAISEQKHFMLERLLKLEDELSMDNKISDEYVRLVEMTDIIRKLYNSYCHKRQDQLLCIIKEKLLFVKEQEETLLRKMIQKVEEIMLK